MTRRHRGSSRSGATVTHDAASSVLVRGVRLETQQASLEATIAALAEFGSIHALRIDAPTTIIAGTRDRLFPPAASRHLAGAIAPARYVELPTGHMSNIEAASAFTAEIIRAATPSPT
jgi:pimeloyl-ACP methyl ester carboxylesterase